MIRKYIIVADDSIKGFDEGIAQLEREWDAEEIEPCNDYISRQTVLKAIKNLYPGIPVVDINGARLKWLRKYKPYFECEKVVEQLPSVTPQQKIGQWISVSERLPTKEEYIANNGLFIVFDGDRTYAEYFDVYNSKKYFGEPTMNGFRVDRYVIAWMPLPEPYKAESEDNNI